MVSRKAPNYPDDVFPDGIRIHFHVNGVFNGCEKRAASCFLEHHAPTGGRLPKAEADVRQGRFSKDERRDQKCRLSEQEPSCRGKQMM